MKHKYVGYSNGKAYPLSRLGKYPKTGWCKVDGINHSVCCTFEKIVKYDNRKTN